jgi:hypothetical protein
MFDKKERRKKRKKRRTRDWHTHQPNFFALSLKGWFIKA